MHCRILPYHVDSGPANMAIDEALLESVSEAPGAAVLRTYGWSQPTLSLGYFQRHAEVSSESRFAGAPVVRRPTGGGAIWHDRELTYAVILPRAHPLGRQAADLYRAVHEALAALLRGLGTDAARRAAGPEPTRPAPGSDRSAPRPFLCFTDRDPEDIVVLGTKVVGSAQRRRPGAILQHGSLLLGRSAVTPELPGVADLARLDPTVTAWVGRVEQAIPAALGLEPLASAMTREELRRAEALEREVYRNETWTCKR